MARCPYLIIGNSTAALGAIEGIRSIDPERRITLVAKETDPIYARPLIPYWLAGKIGDEQMSFVPHDFNEANRIDAMLGAEVVSINAASRTVTLADGREIEFETLMIAGGGAPILPPEPDVEGVEGIGTFTCWDDARWVKSWTAKRDVRRAVVVGGGFIGIKTVEALHALGIAPTIVELSDRIMGVAFDEPSAEMARASLTKRGIAVRCGTAVDAISRSDGRITGATLRDGRAIDCQLLLFAIGVRPNVAFLKDSGIALGRGIIVDDRLATNVPGVYAAGDITEGLDRLSGAKRPIPILRNARRQGGIAGANMAGGDERFKGGVAMNSTDVCGLPCISVGLANPPADAGYDTLVRRNDARQCYKKVVLMDDRVVGAICIGEIARAGVLRHLIEEQIDISGCKGHLLDDDFPLDILPPTYWQRGPAMAP